MTQSRRKFAFPSAYSVLLLVIVLCAGVTWLLPAGRFDALRYDAARRVFIAERAAGEETLPGEQATLDQLGIRIPLEHFASGSIRKPVSIPRTYHRVAPNRQGFLALLKAPVLGTADAFEVVLFVLVIGGFIGVFNQSGAAEAGIQALVKRLRGREAWLIILIGGLIALGGTTIGLAEETLAFYPLVVPVFLAAGYDRLVPVAVIFIGTSVGTMASTINPFSTIIASHAAGVVWTSGLGGRALMCLLATAIGLAWTMRYAAKVRRDPSLSLVPVTDEKIEQNVALKPPPTFTAKTRLLLAIFALTFVAMIYGVSRLEWWFPEMTTLFFAAALVIGIIDRPGEREFVRRFLAGASYLLGVGLIIGLARGATIMLERGEMSGTILEYASTAVAHMPPVPFILALLSVYMGLAFFIQSSSGMAVLTMPIMSGLADAVGVPREQIINAFMWGVGLMSFIAPTGLLLPSLAMVGVPFNAWLRFIWPLMAMLVALAAVFLVAGVFLARP